MMAHQVLVDFIKMYRNSPCLWQVSSKQYHDRNKRNAAYNKLTEKLKEIEPGATRDSVVKKINNIRSSYRKEKKKIKQSMKPGASSEDIYKPKLWYFPLLSFLNDPNARRNNRSNNVESEDDDACDENTFKVELLGDTTNYNGMNEICEQETSSERSINIKSPKAKRKDLAKDVLVNISDHFKRPRKEDDRFDLIGKSIALKLRELPKHQMLFAERIINETLFEAEMGNLDMTYRLITDRNSDHSEYDRDMEMTENVEITGI